MVEGIGYLTIPVFCRLIQLGLWALSYLVFRSECFIPLLTFGCISTLKDTSKHLKGPQVSIFTVIPIKLDGRKLFQNYV